MNNAAEILKSRLTRSKERLTSLLAMGWSMRLRLFAFFMLQVMTMLGGVACVLLLTGALSSGVGENRRLIESELGWMARNLEKQFGEISSQALRLSRHLSRNIENRLADRGLSVKDLGGGEALLEKILDGEYDTLFFSLEQARTSSVFVILNATAGRREHDLRSSRSGLFIKDWEPNILNESSSAKLMLRGFSRVGLRHDAVLDAQWAMEFDVEGAEYYYRPQETAEEHPEFLRRLYWWQPATVIRGTSYRGMLCSVPLVDSNGTVFGVCGFEVSDMFFRLTWMPGSIYERIFCVLAPMEGQTLTVSEGLISWRYLDEGEPQAEGELVAAGSPQGLATYTGKGGKVFMGLHRPLALYSKESPFADRRFVLAFLVPRGAVEASISARNRQLLALSLALLAMGMGCSFVLSKWYIRPVLMGLDAIRGAADAGSEKPLRTNIPEIDDLLEFLRSQPEDSERYGSGYGPFLENVESLTPAERNVFDLYLEGRSAKEIAVLLHLSPNTIKTHNRRIFMKLNVSSRRELLAYVQRLQMSGVRIGSARET